MRHCYQTCPFEILPTLQDGDSHKWTFKPERENIPGRVDITVVSNTALTAGPFSCTQPLMHFGPVREPQAEQVQVMYASPTSWISLTAQVKGPR